MRASVQAPREPRMFPCTGRARTTQLVCVAAMILCAAAGFAVADQIVLRPTRDNTLFEDENGSLSNGSGPGLFVGNNAAANTRRAVLRFDVASHLPDRARIERVQLRFRVSSTPNLTSRTVTLHRVLRDWGEATSATSGGRGAPAATGDATWLHRFYPDSLWTAPGGDFDTRASFTGTLGDTGFYQWAGGQMVADVAFWLQHPEADFGWLLQGEETEPSTVRRIDSREVEAESDRPELLIEFTPVGTGVESGTWGPFKNRYRPSR